MQTVIQFVMQTVIQIVMQTVIQFAVQIVIEAKKKAVSDDPQKSKKILSGHREPLFCYRSDSFLTVSR